MALTEDSEVSYELGVSEDLKVWRILVSCGEQISLDELIVCVRSFLKDLEGEVAAEAAPGTH